MMSEVRIPADRSAASFSTMIFPTEIQGLSISGPRHSGQAHPSSTARRGGWGQASGESAEASGQQASRARRTGPSPWRTPWPRSGRSPAFLDPGRFVVLYGFLLRRMGARQVSCLYDQSLDHGFSFASSRL